MENKFKGNRELILLISVVRNKESQRNANGKKTIEIITKITIRKDFFLFFWKLEEIIQNYFRYKKYGIFFSPNPLLFSFSLTSRETSFFVLVFYFET